MKARGWSQRLWTADSRMAYMLLAPMVLVIFGLVAYPFLRSVLLSMSLKYIGSSDTQFIGFKHYVDLARDFAFRKAVRNTLVWAFGSVSIKLVLGMAMALVLNQSFRGFALIRGLLLIPWVIPTAISALVWMWMFNDMVGVFNWALLNLGIIDWPIAWLGTGSLAMASVITVNVWRGTPFFGLTLLAGLKSIPGELYEAARVDGAGRISTFFHITIPSLKNVILIASLLESIWALADFSIVYIMTKGGPAKATHLFSTLSYEIGFLAGDLGRAVAISLYAFPVLALLIIFVTRLMEKGN